MLVTMALSQVMGYLGSEDVNLINYEAKMISDSSQIFIVTTIATLSLVCCHAAAGPPEPAPTGARRIAESIEDGQAQHAALTTLVVKWIKVAFIVLERSSCLRICGSNLISRASW